MARGRFPLRDYVLQARHDINHAVISRVNNKQYIFCNNVYFWTDIYDYDKKK